MVGTPTLWFAFAPAMLWLVWRIVARRDPAAITVAVAIAAGWLTWFLNLERTMFIFYMAPVVPFFVLAVTLALQDVLGRPGADTAGAGSSGLGAVCLYIALVAATFVFFYPILAGEPLLHRSGCCGCGSRHGSDGALAALHSWGVQLSSCQPSSPSSRTCVLRLSALTARRDGLSRTAAATLTRLRDAGPTRLTELAVRRGCQPALDERPGGPAGRPGPDPPRRRPAATPAWSCSTSRRPAPTSWRSGGPTGPPAWSGRWPSSTASTPALITDALPALTRLADALRRSSTPAEVTR